MIFGSGLLAQAFSSFYMHSDDICIYASGVSNSLCNDPFQFERERICLSAALQQAKHVDAFVYFGTCSIADPETHATCYVQHKLAMENLVRSHSRYLILRLPQVVGKSQNPHTLLNFLYSKILRGEVFDLWSKSYRNIIDVDDVSIIAQQLIACNSVRNVSVNIANPVNYSVPKIVAAIESFVGKRGLYKVVESGCEYSIDVRQIIPLAEQAKISFCNSYLVNLLNKYYNQKIA
jgi:nucleoside-diphosphate-sugar epimerase